MKKSDEMFRVVGAYAASGLSRDKYADSMGISRNTVRRYYRRLKDYDGSLEVLRARGEPEVHALFNPPVMTEMDQQRYDVLSGMAPALLDDLQSKSVTKQLVWEEYRVDNPAGYGYCQFCNWLGELSKVHTASMIQDIAPGEVVYIDFAGDFHTARVLRSNKSSKCHRAMRPSISFNDANSVMIVSRGTCV